MQNSNSLQDPLEPVEALMCIRAILDATVDRDANTPMGAALRLIEIALDKALPNANARETPPADGNASSS